MASQEYRKADVCRRCPNTICLVTSNERRIIDLPSYYGNLGKTLRARVRECKDMVVDQPVSDSAEISL